MRRGGDGGTQGSKETTEFAVSFAGYLSSFAQNHSWWEGKKETGDTTVVQ